MPGSTPSQTVGPFFAFGLPFEGGERLVDPSDAGRDPDRGHGVRRRRRAVLDDALIEIWQANRAGRYRHPEDDARRAAARGRVHGFGRCPTDAEGQFRFVTVKPGASRPQAPHINVIVLARGLLRHLFTRIYFPDEAEANAADPLLSSLEDDAAARDLDRASRSTACCASTSTSRASARPPSSMSEHL